MAELSQFAASPISDRLCLGIDPSTELLQSWGLPLSASGAKRFAEICIAAAAGCVTIVKPQVAFFEQFGTAGFKALEEICEAATHAGYRVIADAKRSDIGSSLAGYTQAWLSQDSPFAVAALTVSPFMGVRGLSQMIEAAAVSGRTVFVLVATSNPEGRSIQAGSGKSLAFQILSEAMSLPAADASLGVVIGANLNLREYGLQRIKAEPLGVPILAPGFGVQGAKLSEAVSRFGNSSNWVVPNIGRGVLQGGAEALPLRLREAKAQLA